MPQLDYIKYVGSKGFLEDQCSAELFDFSDANFNENSRMEAATLVSTACFETDSGFNKEKLYNTFVKKCETPLEFIRSNYVGTGIKQSYRNIKFETFGEGMDGTGKAAVKEYNSIIQAHKDTIACFKLRIPLKVVGHIVRHRNFSFMQTSRRYTKVEPYDFYINEKVPRNMAKSQIRSGIESYQRLLELGIKPEDARDVLPSYALMTTLWVMGDVKAFQNFFRLRYYENLISGKVMHETFDTAKAMILLIEEHQPTLYNRMKHMKSGINK